MMMRPQLLTSAVALALALSAACNRAETQQEARDAAADLKAAAARAGDTLADSWLTAKVQAKFFADDDIKARYIDVSSNDGVVSLKGFVESDAVRQEALTIARTTDGVRQVDDRLLIGRAPDAPPVAGGPVATTGSPAPGTEPAVEPIEDSMVTSLVQAKYYTDPTIRTRDIEVQTSNGVVTLRGRVASDTERAQALLLARTTQGVARVEDGLTVDATVAPQPSAAAPLPSAPGVAPTGAPAAPASTGVVGTAGVRTEDSGLEETLKNTLAADAQLKAAQIEVTARDGVALLQGTVPTQAAKQRALTAARRTEGVVQVVDRLSVAPRR